MPRGQGAQEDTHVEKASPNGARVIRKQPCSSIPKFFTRYKRCGPTVGHQIGGGSLTRHMGFQLATRERARPSLEAPPSPQHGLAILPVSMCAMCLKKRLFSTE